MDKDKIVLNETENDGKTIFLYYNKTIGAYMAFGLSAYYVTHVVDPVTLYSDELQMPTVILPRKQILELRQSLRKVEHAQKDYYHFETRIPLGDKGYQGWTENILRRKNAVR